MKTISLLPILAISYFSHAQYSYGSISGGYIYNATIDQKPTFIVNTIHQLADPWFCSPEHYSFKQSFHLDLNYGQLITANLGYEISGSYLKPTQITDINYGVIRTMKGDFYQFALKVSYVFSLKKFDIYAKAGLTLANGKMNYRQTNNYSDSNYAFYYDQSMEYVYKSKLTPGFTGTLGVNIPITKKSSFFAEFTYTNQVYTPKTGKMVGYTSHGKDQLANHQHYPYYYQIEFGNSSDFNSTDSPDISKPQKLYKYKYAIGGIGFTAGYKYILWDKKSK